MHNLCITNCKSNKISTQYDPQFEDHKLHTYQIKFQQNMILDSWIANFKSNQISARCDPLVMDSKLYFKKINMIYIAWIVCLLEVG